MPDAVSKLAYQTLQQGKSLVGLAHKELSTRLGQLLAADGGPKTVPVPPEMLNQLRASMDRLLELDWQEAERGCIRPRFCSMPLARLGHPLSAGVARPAEHLEPPQPTQRP